MAAVTSFRILIHDVADFGRIGRVADSAITIENPHAHHAGLVRDRAHYVIQPLAVIAQHVISGAPLDHVADPLGAGERGRFQVLAMQPRIQVSEKRENDDHRCQ